MTYPKISKRGDGRYTAMVTIGKDPKTGKYVRRSVYGKTKTEVKTKIDELNENVIKGLIIPTAPVKLTFEDWCNEWFLMYTNDLTEGTKQRYLGIINNYFIPLLGPIKLSKLTPLQCQRFLVYLRDETNLHPNTIHYVIALLKSILSKAVALEYIGKDPAVHLEPPRKRAPKLECFSEEEAKTFINACDDTSMGNLCKLALFTGLRRSELLGLTWDNIKDDYLVVDHQFGRNKGDVTFYPTKNKRSRFVGLNDFAKAILQSQRKSQAVLQLSSGDNYRNDLSLIFTDKKGKRLHQNTLQRYFKKVCSDIGANKVRFHDLRHTYAVLGIKAGIDIKTISESMGHHSVAFTLDQYAYVTDEIRLDSSEKFNQYFKEYGF